MSRTAALWYVQERPERVTPRRDGNRAQRRAWARERRTQPQQKPEEEKTR